MADISGVVSVTNVARTVFGNKKIVIADLHIGNAADTIAAAGIPFTPAELGLNGVDFLSIEGGTLVYKYDYTNQVINAYTAHGTPGATVLMIAATAAVPHETVRVTAIGYGGR
jgi:hypothetical protein